MKRAVLPGVYLELAGGDGLLYVDACVCQPPEVVFASLGVN